MHPAKTAPIIKYKKVFIVLIFCFLYACSRHAATRRLTASSICEYYTKFMLLGHNSQPLPSHIAICEVKRCRCTHPLKLLDLSIGNGRSRRDEDVYYAPSKRTKVRYKLIGKPPVSKTGVGQTPFASSSLALTAKWIGLLVRFMQPRC